MINGILILIWNWRSHGRTNFSGKHQRAGFNHQVICTLEGKLFAITDPFPSARRDAFAFKGHGLKKYLDESTQTDKGYVGLGLLTPIKRRFEVKKPNSIKSNNRAINRLRAVVGRVTAQVKIWRVLHIGFRRPLRSYARVFSVVRGLVFGGRGTFMNKPLDRQALTR